MRPFIVPFHVILVFLSWHGYLPQITYYHIGGWFECLLFRCPNHFKQVSLFLLSMGAMQVCPFPLYAHSHFYFSFFLHIRCSILISATLLFLLVLMFPKLILCCPTLVYCVSYCLSRILWTLWVTFLEFSQSFLKNWAKIPKLLIFVIYWSHFTMRARSATLCPYIFYGMVPYF